MSRRLHLYTDGGSFYSEAGAEIIDSIVLSQGVAHLRLKGQPESGTATITIYCDEPDLIDVSDQIEF